LRHAEQYCGILEKSTVIKLKPSLQKKKAAFHRLYEGANLLLTLKEMQLERKAKNIPLCVF